MKVLIFWLLFLNVTFSLVKLLPTFGNENDAFGFSVSIFGDYAVVGSTNNTASVFKREGNSWNWQSFLVDPENEEDDVFGISVSISGDYIAVGAVDDDEMGSCVIFKREGDNWNFQTKLVANDREDSDLFGRSVAIDGEYLIVGAPNKDIDLEQNVGVAYIFKRENDIWTQEARITAIGGKAFDKFGSVVDISGDYAILGVMYDDKLGNNVGASYIFHRENNGWVQQQLLNQHDPETNDNFGISVSISGDYAAIGSFGDDDLGSSSGSCYIFKRENDTWVNQTKVLPEDGTGDDYFGYSVSISDDLLIVGAVHHNYQDSTGSTVWGGAAYVFKRENDTWIQEEKHVGTNSNHGDNFGVSVAIQDRNIIIGAPNEDEWQNGAGAVYVSMICEHEHQIGDFCESCEGNWSGDNCDSCLNYFSGENCEVCDSIHFTGESCDTCANQWTGESCDICDFEKYDENCEFFDNFYLGDSVAENRNNIQAIQETNTLINQTTENIKEDLDTLGAFTNNLQQEFDEFKEEQRENYTSFVYSINELAFEIEELKDADKRLNESFIAEISQINIQIESLENGIDGNTMLIQSQNTEIIDSKNKIISINETLTSLIIQTEKNFNLKLEEEKAKTLELQQKYEQMVTINSEINTKMESLGSDLLDAQQAFSDSILKIESLENENKEMTRSIFELERSYEELKQSLEAQIEASKSEISEISASLNSNTSSETVSNVVMWIIIAIVIAVLMVIVVSVLVFCVVTMQSDKGNSTLRKDKIEDISDVELKQY